MLFVFALSSVAAFSPCCHTLDIVSRLSTDQQFFGASGNTSAERFLNELC